MTEAFQVAQRVGDLQAGAALVRATARLRGDGPEAAALARRLDEAALALEGAKAALYARLAEGGEAEAEQLAVTAARQKLAGASADLDRDFPAYSAFADPKPVDLLATAALLGPDEALVLYASADPGASGLNAVGTVFAISRDGYLAADLPPRAELAALARDLRCAAALTDRNCGSAAAVTRGAFSLEAQPAETAGSAMPAGPGFDLALARRACLLLLDPVAEVFAGKTSLIVVPDRTLSALPFALLLTEDSSPDTDLNRAPWLIRQLAVTIVPSVAGLAALRRGKPGAAQNPFLGIGDPLIGVQAAAALPYDCATLFGPGLPAPAPPALLAASLAAAPILRGGGIADRAALTALPALPETRCELLRAANLFGGPKNLLLQGDATETRLKALSEAGDLARYRVVAFATHGLIAGELGAENAGLVLTPPESASAADDGLLTTAEIARLRLDADFVILSACNTAAGSAEAQEGFSGLASAFFLAGARSLLVSHWPVYSDAATRLTSGMVFALAEDARIGRAEALRRAMLALLDDPQAGARAQHPAYWAPFLIAGDGAGR